MWYITWMEYLNSYGEDPTTRRGSLHFSRQTTTVCGLNERSWRYRHHYAKTQAQQALINAKVRISLVYNIVETQSMNTRRLLSPPIWLAQPCCLPQRSSDADIRLCRPHKSSEPPTKVCWTTKPISSSWSEESCIATAAFFQKSRLEAVFVLSLISLKIGSLPVGLPTASTT